MDFINRMNQGIKYVDRHLTENIDFGELERITLCSEYHFKKMFSSLSGIPLSEYIRRRRLSLAAFELTNTNLRVIDIALKYGYNSSDSFARAFQKVHGITPSEAKKDGYSLKSYPPMTLQLSIVGGNEMEYRIVEKEAFSIVGLKKRVPIIFEGVNPEIASMWESLNEDMIKSLKTCLTLNREA